MTKTESVLVRRGCKYAFTLAGCFYVDVCDRLLAMSTSTSTSEMHMPKYESPSEITAPLTPIELLTSDMSEALKHSHAAWQSVVDHPTIRELAAQTDVREEMVDMFPRAVLSFRGELQGRGFGLTIATSPRVLDTIRQGLSGEVARALVLDRASMIEVSMASGEQPRHPQTGGHARMPYQRAFFPKLVASHGDGGSSIVGEGTAFNGNTAFMTPGGVAEHTSKLQELSSVIDLVEWEGGLPERDDRAASRGYTEGQAAAGQLMSPEKIQGRLQKVRSTLGWTSVKSWWLSRFASKGRHAKA